jgi:hypothetical protein
MRDKCVGLADKYDIGPQNVPYYIKYVNYC